MMFPEYNASIQPMIKAEDLLEIETENTKVELFYVGEGWQMFIVTFTNSIGELDNFIEYTY